MFARFTILTVLYTVLLTGPLAAQLSEQEVADGWLSLLDLPSTTGWELQSGTVKESDQGLTLKAAEGPVVLISAARFGAGEVVIDYRGSFELDFHGRHELPVECQRGRIVVEPVDGRLRIFSEFRQPGSVVREETQIYRPLTGLRRQAIKLRVPKGGTAIVRSLKFRPIGMKSLFNGRDLTGWRIHPGERYTSRFEVSPRKTLRVLDGPGDLQTKNQFQDFLFQATCRTNGKHLNSGIFFRCLPEQYQQGYEAQIRNQWQGDNRSRPVDFGTGGIYRRQPARKVVSNDQEWFTLTILADGNHLLTWVNGVLTADFIDNRPKADNARKGTKLGPGCISIQGHDPTTDLEFRQLRVQELPPKGDK